MQKQRSRSATRALAAWTGSFAALFAVFCPVATQTATANGDTRTIYLYHSHTKESIEATYRVDGHYDTAVLEKLNWFLRDWRVDEPTKMDPRLFDVVWETYRTAGATEPVVVVSAYRSPKTNAMLRRRSRAVAEHSQHMLGKAMDTTMPNMSMEKIREVGMKLQRGGVGYYGASNFVHLDVGNVRSWPRMSYDQLARLFPDGKTVHLAADGRTLARYEEARAEIESTGGIASEAPTRSKGLFAFLFGGGKDEEDDEVAAAPARRGWGSGRTPVGAVPSRGAPTQVASAGNEDADRNLFVAKAYQAPASAPVQEAERNLPRGETYMSAGPATPAATIADDSAAASPETALPLPPRRPFGQHVSFVGLERGDGALRIDLAIVAAAFQRLGLEVDLLVIGGEAAFEQRDMGRERAGARCEIELHGFSVAVIGWQREDIAYRNPDCHSRF
ncbi:MAG: hypothetical protein NVSMB26_03810 [Beijerinckiaceae bacterium]